MDTKTEYDIEVSKIYFLGSSKVERTKQERRSKCPKPRAFAQNKKDVEIKQIKMPVEIQNTCF